MDGRIYPQEKRMAGGLPATPSNLVHPLAGGQMELVVDRERDRNERGSAG
jgi:hypothetical protein